MASVSSLDKDLSRLRLSKYTTQEANEVLQWIVQILQIPQPPANTDLLEFLKDGVALCKLVSPLLNTPLRPRASKMPFVQMENIALFLTAISQPPISLPPPDLFLTVDLFEKKDPAQVLQTLNAFSRVAYRLKPALYNSPIGGPIGPLRSGAASPPPLASRVPSMGRSSTFSPTSPTRAPFPPQGVQRSETAGLIENSSFRKSKPLAPAWNVAQYGGPGGASQGNLGVSFGGVRQITSPGPMITSSREKETRQRKEQEEEQFRKEEQEKQQREYEQQRAEAERQRQQEDDDRIAREERRLAQLQEEARRVQENLRLEEERIQALRREKEREETALQQQREREERLRLEQERQSRSREEEDYQASRESERLRIKELERELQRAREREQRYEQEREAARRNEVETRRKENAELVQRPLRTGERPVVPARTGDRPALPQRTNDYGRPRAESRSERSQYVRSHRTGEREMVLQHSTGEREIIRIQRTGSPNSPLPPPASSYPIREDVYIQTHRTGGSTRDQNREEERAFLQDAWTRHGPTSGQEGYNAPRSTTPVVVSPGSRALPTPPRRNNGPSNGQFRDPPRSSGDWGQLPQQSVQSVVVPSSPASPKKARWGGSSFLERERERERQRQKEWEQEQLGRDEGEFGARSRGVGRN